MALHHNVDPFLFMYMQGMTVLTLTSAPSLACQLAEKSFPPDGDLNEAVNELAKLSGLPQPWSLQVFNDFGDVINVMPGRSVGTDPLRVQIVSTEVESLKATVANLTKQVAANDKATAVANTPRLCNLAAMILLHSASDVSGATSRTTTTDYFYKLGAGHAGITGIATHIKNATNIRMSLSEVISILDKVVQQRNATIHPGSVADLDREVAELADAITPALKAKCFWECFIVENYSMFKTLFPDGFKSP
jgi:hypothetical protein